MIMQELRRKIFRKKAGKRQKLWIREYIKGENWARRRKWTAYTAAGIFFAGWTVLWLYWSAGKKMTETNIYPLPEEQQENFYPGKSIEVFGIQIRIHEGNITFFREKREAEIEEY